VSGPRAYRGTLNMTTVVIIIAYVLFIAAVRYIIFAPYQVNIPEEKTRTGPAQARGPELREPAPPELRIS
jgi:hypothetical protein